MTIHSLDPPAHCSGMAGCPQRGQGQPSVALLLKRLGEIGIFCLLIKSALELLAASFPSTRVSLTENEATQRKSESREEASLLGTQTNCRPQCLHLSSGDII